MLLTFLTVAFVAANIHQDYPLLCRQFCLRYRTPVFSDCEIRKSFVRRRYPEGNLLEMTHFDNCDLCLLHTVIAVLPFCVFNLLKISNPPRNNNCLKLVAVQNVPPPKRRVCLPSMSKPPCEKRQGTANLVSCQAVSVINDLEPPSLPRSKTSKQIRRSRPRIEELMQTWQLSDSGALCNDLGPLLMPNRHSFRQQRSGATVT